MSSSASNGAPISPATRSRSSSPDTSPRSASSSVQFTPLAGVGGSACQVERNTESACWPGSRRQISSAVNDRIGASQRVIASAMCHNDVCAERRAWLSAGVV